MYYKWCKMTGIGNKIRTVISAIGLLGLGILIGYDIGGKDSKNEIDKLSGIIKAYENQEVQSEYEKRVVEPMLKSDPHDDLVVTNNHDDFCEVNKNTRNPVVQKMIQSACKHE